MTSFPYTDCMVKPRPVQISPTFRLQEGFVLAGNCAEGARFLWIFLVFCGICGTEPEEKVGCYVLRQNREKWPIGKG